MKWKDDLLTQNDKFYLLDKLQEYADSIEEEYVGVISNNDDIALFDFLDRHRAETIQGNEKIRKLLKEKGFSRDGIDGLEALMEHIWERLA
tara:strand:+ start:406 stop:678 length:273 start_codon:yes stop_codon:yes gene_type:complete